MKFIAGTFIAALVCAAEAAAESEANLRTSNSLASTQKQDTAAAAVGSPSTMTQKERDEKWEFDFMHNKITVDVEVDRCTAIVVGPKAGKEGAMTTHTADCLNCDFRVGKVPARDWPAGTMRPLYIYRGAYPSVVSKNRGATWDPSNLQGTPEQLAAWGEESLITGYIPQVPHTFALYEGGYGIINEHQVAIGESTCAAKFYGVPVTAGGLARIEVAEMTKIALERSTTARQAIQMMGDLATELGFYAADWVGGDMSKGEGGEALTVIDKTEAWMFHVLGDDTGASAVWVAQRLEPDHVAAVANSFVIREIDPHSPNFLYSANIFDVAERNGLWSRASGQKLDFLRTYAPLRSHSEYSTRRVWRVLDNVAPSLRLPGVTTPYGDDYPFSVKAERLLGAEDLMALHRDHYEGTEFDLTKGLAAGPFGDPTRWDSALNDNMTRPEMLSGGYERAISMFRTSYSFVALSRAAVPDALAMMWYGNYNPASSSYAPFYVASEHLPPSYTRGSLFNYDSSVAFWNFLAAGNYAGRMYRYAMKEVKATQDIIHATLVADVAVLETAMLAVLKADALIGTAGSGAVVDAAVVQALTQFVNDRCAFVVQEWQQLLPRLISKYHDGMMALNTDEPEIFMKRLFYPKWWLQATGYFNQHGDFGPGVILFAPNPADTTDGGEVGAAAAVGDAVASGYSNIGYFGGLLLTCLLSSASTLAVIYYYMALQQQQQDMHGGVSLKDTAAGVWAPRHQYTPIPNASL